MVILRVEKLRHQHGCRYNKKKAVFTCKENAQVLKPKHSADTFHHFADLDNT
jgi:hypothetical protein